MRNVSFLLAQQGFYALGGFLFAALVPRLMGPQIYGRYALISSLSIWLMLFSGLGLTQVIGRYVPQFITAGEREPLKLFMGNLLKLRLASGLLVALVYLGLTLLWLRDLDPLVLAFMAAAIWVRTVSNLLFTYFLGINRPPNGAWPKSCGGGYPWGSCCRVFTSAALEAPAWESSWPN